MSVQEWTDLSSLHFTLVPCLITGGHCGLYYKFSACVCTGKLKKRVILNWLTVVSFHVDLCLSLMYYVFLHVTMARANVTCTSFLCNYLVPDTSASRGCIPGRSVDMQIQKEKP